MNTASQQQPLVSIAMSARNAEATVELTIRSVLSQTLRDWELLFIDDGSSDNTAAIAESFGDPRIRVHRGERSLGLAVRLNQAIGMAQGRYIARMDADDVCYPERLQKQVNYLDEHPELDLIASGALFIDEDNRPIGLFPFAGTSHEQLCRRRMSGFYFPHPTWMGRVEWFRRHRYRETMHKSQDQDLLLRSWRESRFALVPEVLLGYRQHRFSLRGSLHSRQMLAGAQFRAFMAQGEPARALLAIAGQLGKGAVELTLAVTGLTRLILRVRRRELPERVIEQWEHCLRRIETAARSSDNPITGPSRDH